MLAASTLAQASASDTPLPDSCRPPPRDHGIATVAHVYDGDTVRLADGRRVRLVGLDSPEFRHQDPGGKPDAFAEAARDALSNLLAAHGQRVRLVHDRDRHDRYRRALAHLFTPDGRSVTALLLAQGLALRLTVPPNDWNLDCYRDAERAAAGNGLGIWSLPDHRLFRTADLPRNATGFRRVEGRVVRIGESRRSLWLNLEDDVALRIDREDLEYFGDTDVRSLDGVRVVARGEVYNHRDQLRIRIRHPADLDIIDTEQGTPAGTP